MCDVTKENFEDLFPSIEQDIKEAKFIAIDTEFTGLTSSEAHQPSLFDGTADRYKKLKETITRITPLQIGISVFKRNRSVNKYVAHSYNFALYPASFGPIDARFICQASCLQFLCNHDFDFNKVMYKGVSFLNDEQEKTLREHLEAQDHTSGSHRDINEEALQACCTEVTEWLIKANDGEIIPFYTPGVDERIAMTEIRERFSEVWAYMLNGQLMIEKMSAEKKVEIMQKHRKDEHNRIMNGMLGFTRVFRVLLEQKKVLLGHNHLMDLMIIHDKFYRPLPDSYTKFKSTIHELFPSIYDTKHIVTKFRRKYEETGYFDAKNLEQIYKNMSGEDIIFRVLYSPQICHAEGFNRYTDSFHHPHEAGYDAFMCGYAFIRMAHFEALFDAESSEVEAQTFSSHLSVMEPYKNKVNIIRGSIYHTCLDGEDPPHIRPDFLYVQPRAGVQTFTSGQLARLFSAYGSVDIRMNSRNSALVAVSTWGSAKDILRKYHKHDQFYVARYRVWKHSPIARGILGVSALAVGGSCLWILWSGLRDTKS